MTLPSAQILEHIEADDLSAAISLLLEFTQSTRSRFRKEVILHSADLQEILRQERTGLSPQSYTRREKKRIALALMDLLDELAKETPAGRPTFDPQKTAAEEAREYFSQTNHVMDPDLPRDRMEQEQRPQNVLEVFLCHSSNDRPLVRQLYDRLKHESWINPWLDSEKLLPGMDWDLEIRSAVRASDIVLICLSKDSINTGGYIQKEIRRALDLADEKPEGTIFIIPLRLEICEIPDRLKRWHSLDLFDNESYDKLLRSLRKRAADLAKKDAGTQ